MQNNLGCALLAAGNVKEARKCFERAIASNPKCALGLNNLGLVCLEEKALDQALVYFERAFAADPSLKIAQANRQRCAAVLSQQNRSKAV